MNILFETMPFI